MEGLSLLLKKGKGEGNMSGGKGIHNSKYTPFVFCGWPSYYEKNIGTGMEGDKIDSNYLL